MGDVYIFCKSESELKFVKFLFRLDFVVYLEFKVVSGGFRNLMVLPVAQGSCDEGGHIFLYPHLPS